MLYPDAEIPVTALSVNADLAPAEQNRIGTALSGLRAGLAVDGARTRLPDSAGVIVNAGHYLNSFTAAFKAATANERKRMGRTFVHHLELDPNTHEVRVALYPNPMVNSTGVGGGT